MLDHIREHLAALFLQCDIGFCVGNSRRVQYAELNVGKIKNWI